MARTGKGPREKSPRRSLGGRLVAVAVLVPLAAWLHRPVPVEPPSLSRLLRLSMLALQAGNLEQARKQAFAILERADLPPWALARLAEIFFGCQNVDAAISAALRGLEQDPAHHDLRFQLGMARAAQGLHLPSEARMDEAVAILSGLVEEYPDEYLPRLHLGNLFRLQRQADPAIHHLEEAIRIAPESAHGHNMLGICYEWRDRWEDAERAYRNSLRVDPTIFKAYTNLGALFHKRGRPDLARQWYRRSLGVNPNYGRTQVLLRRLEAESG